MSRFRDENPECKVYIGDLTHQASKQDVEDAFSYYGPIKNVWVARNPPGFAFVEFEDVRDAEDAVKEVDGRRTVCGRRVRVERASTKRERGGGYRRPFRGSGRRGRSFHPEDRCFECGNKGHYARDCRNRKKKQYNRGRYSRSRSRSKSRGRRSRSHRRSRSRNRRSRSRDRRSRSGGRRSRSPSSSSRSSRSESTHKSRSRSISRSNNKKENKSPSKQRSRSNSLAKANSSKISNDKSHVMNGDG